MRLFLEMLWVKECHSLRGGGGIFPHAENLELLFLRSLV